MWVELITAIYCLALLVADFTIVTKEIPRNLGFLALGGAVIFIFGRRVLSIVGGNYEGYWWNGAYDVSRVEARDWPPFVYALAGYVCLLFATFPLIDAFVTGGVNP